MTWVASNQRCHGADCDSLNLIEAHIIPKGFARFIRQGHHNLILTKKQTKKTPQLGEADWNILCRDCDGKLGRYDEALLNAAKTFRRSHKNQGSVWSLPPVDPNQFARGVFAILWRASLRQRNDFRRFSLGKYQNIIRDILFDKTTFDANPAISLLVQRYTSKHFDTSGFFTDPSLDPFMGLNAGGLSLAGFRFLAKFDEKPLSPGYDAFDVTRCGLVRGLYVEIEKTPEFEHIAEMVAGDIRRSQAKTRRHPPR